MSLPFFRKLRKCLWIVLPVSIFCRCSGFSKKPPAPNVYKVEIKQMKFYPEELWVNKGDSIIFINHDMVTHNVTDERDRDWASTPIVSGASWGMVFTQNLDYFCTIHPMMKGALRRKYPTP